MRAASRSRRRPAGHSGERLRRFIGARTALVKARPAPAAAAARRTFVVGPLEGRHRSSRSAASARGRYSMIGIRITARHINCRRRRWKRSAVRCTAAHRQFFESHIPPDDARQGQAHRARRAGRPTPSALICTGCASAPGAGTATRDAPSGGKRDHHIQAAAAGRAYRGEPAPAPAQCMISTEKVIRARFASVAFFSSSLRARARSARGCMKT